MNPIAVVMIAIGVVLFLFGLFLVFQRRKATGITISLMGVGMATVPFWVSFFLGLGGEKL